MKPRFISLEGGEGSGKSTQAEILSAALGALGYPVLRTREPGGSGGAEAIRDLLLGRGGWDRCAEMVLHFAARREHWARSIAPCLDAGAWVVCDRFFDSTLAYQVGGQGAPEALWRQLREATLGDAAPDLTLLLDLPAELGLARAASRGEVNRYEAAGTEFHQRVRETFLNQAAAEPARFAVIDAAAPTAAVSGAIMAACRQRLGLP